MLREPQVKPLTGIGAAGWLAVTVLGVLVGLVVLGVELRFEFMRLIHALGGRDVTYGFVYLIIALHFSAMSCTFDFVGLLILAVTLRVYPYRVRPWALGLIIVWCLARSHVLYWSRFVGVPILELVGLGGSIPAGDAIDGAFEIVTAALLWAVTRSGRVAGVFLVLAWTLTGVQVALGPATWAAGVSAGHIVRLCTWYAGITAILLAWAIYWRRYAVEPRCPACGYRSEGLTASHCPECGTERGGFGGASCASVPKHTACREASARRS